MLPTGTTQPQVVVAHPSAATGAEPASGPNRPPLQSCGILGLGITQIVLGGVCIVASIVALAAGCEGDKAKNGANGIWAGIFYVLTGAFGVAAGKHKKKGLIVAFMIMSIIAAVLTITTLSFGAASVGQARDEYSYYNYHGYHCYGSHQTTSIIMGSILIVAALAEAVVAITASALCCGAVCCNRPSPGTVYIPAQTFITSTGQQAYITGSNQQVLVIHTSGQPQAGYPPSTGVTYPQPTPQYPPTAGPAMPPPYANPEQTDMNKPPPYNPNM